MLKPRPILCCKAVLEHANVLELRALFLLPQLSPAISEEQERVFLGQDWQHHSGVSDKPL